MEAIFIAAMIGAISVAGVAALAAALRLVRPTPQPVRVRVRGD